MSQMSFRVRRPDPYKYGVQPGLGIRKDILDIRTPVLLVKNDATARLQSLQWRVIFAERGMCPNVPNVLPCAEA